MRTLPLKWWFEINGTWQTNKYTVHDWKWHFRILYPALEQFYYISRCPVQFIYWRDSHPDQVCTKRVQPGKYFFCDISRKRLILCEIFSVLGCRKSGSFNSALWRTVLWIYVFDAICTCLILKNEVCNFDAWKNPTHFH